LGYVYVAKESCVPVKSGYEPVMYFSVEEMEKQKQKNKGKECSPPHKILRHMFIILRIQRLFHCKQLAMLQGWHSSHISEIRVIRIPTDSIAMKHIEDTWPDKFKGEVWSL
jgi:hypothetical protein